MTKKIFFSLFIILIIYKVPVYAIEKGNPTAAYYQDKIIMPDNNEIFINDTYIALFINGSLVLDYEVVIRENNYLVPLRFISQEMGAIVTWDDNKKQVRVDTGQNQIIITIDKNKYILNGKEVEIDYPAILHNEITYVPLRFIAENINATVVYAPQLTEKNNEYYYDTQMPISPANTIIRNFPNIIIDEKYDGIQSISQEDALKKAQDICFEGLSNFQKSLTTSLINSGESPDRFDDIFRNIHTEINRMVYLGEISRYDKFTIGPYDILVDKFNQNVFFQIYSTGIIVKEVDVNDPSLYTLVFISG